MSLWPNRTKSVETADIERQKAVKLSEQDREIAIAERSKAQSEAQAQADHARADAVQAEEAVVTVRERERAEREKTVELVEARKVAERDAIGLVVAAEAKKQAAEDEADAIRILAEAEAERERIAAAGEMEAERLRVAAAELRYAADAAGRRAINEAENLLSEAVIGMKIKIAIVEQLSGIIRESVKPLENIDGIKIIQLDGLNGSSAGGDGTVGGSLGDQVVASALRYRSQAPLIDSLMQEVGLDGSSLDGLTRGLRPNGGNGSTAPATGAMTVPTAQPDSSVV